MRYVIPGVALISVACGASPPQNDHELGASAGSSNVSGGNGGVSGASGASGSVNAAGGSGGSTSSSGGTDLIGGTSGSTSGGSGAGGTVAVPPITVGACDDLPASGTWQKINPPDANPASTFDDGLTGDVVTDPIDSGTVYVGVKGFGIYKSTDCGATWTKLNTGRNADMVRRGTNISIQ
ncbi:MAG TPA: hypothetical protein VGP93_17450, partial [Polyangiaceae bacterium]|nr:hypothetical protein [Polyangiaceae bacterium]